MLLHNRRLAHRFLPQAYFKMGEVELMWNNTFLRVCRILVIVVFTFVLLFTKVR